MTEARARVLTPLRESAPREADGCRLLSEQQETDGLAGSEEGILEILASAGDLSSLSDELELKAAGPQERYHLSKSRANIMRALDLRADEAVLEVGAGYGSITRYLGEVCGAVDALEPVRSRARVARERTRDLENVEIFVGGVEDVPAEPAYDTIVIVGALEYACGGSDDPADYTTFLWRLVKALNPGGRIVSATNNRLGVKYLAGAPEPHTNRAFDGLEGYLNDAPARTFSRDTLTEAFREADLAVDVYHAFPDHHQARIVYSDALLESEARSLAWEAPVFPSADCAGERPRLVSEGLLCKSLVEAGLGGQIANGFLVVARKGGGRSFWPEEQLAAFYSTHRQARLATETRLLRDSSGLRLERRRLADSEPRVRTGPLYLEVRSAPFVPGESALTLMSREDDEGLQRWISRWRELLHEELASEGPPSIDIGLPHMVVLEDGKVVLIDQEMTYEGYGMQEVLERQIIWLGIYLCERTIPERWEGESVKDVVVLLGGMAGLDSSGDWIPAAVRREAELQAIVADGRLGSDVWEDVVAGVEGHINNLLEARLEDGPLGTREHELREEAEKLVETALAEAESARAERDRVRAESQRELRAKQAKLAQVRRDLRVRDGELQGALRRISDIENSVGWQVLNRVRPFARRVAPRGSVPYKVMLAGMRAGAATVRMPGRAASLALRPVRGRRVADDGGVAHPGGRPRVKSLTVGCYGEHCWTVGGGTVHALQLLLPLAPYFDIELLLPPGAPLRDRKWYMENMNIDIGDIRVRHYENGIEDTYDVWFSVWNERIWPAATPKRFNMVFFPFVSLDGTGFTHIVNSNYTAAHTRERYGTDDIVVVPPWIDPEEFRTGPKEPTILHVSRFSMPSAYADKAHIAMIQAFKQLYQRGLHGWKLVLAGATLDEGEETYANYLGKHAYGFPIEIKPNLPSDDLRDLFARASIYWHATGYSVKEPAAQEHFGITIVEAMASGAVPVSLKSGGPTEIIESGHNGFLFESMEEMVEQTWDVATRPDRWRKLSRAAQKRAKDYAPERIAPTLVSTVCKTDKVSIIIGTHNNREVLQRALDSIFRHTAPGYELIVVDNASTDGTGLYLASLEYPHLKVVKNRTNMGFAAFNNRGMKVATKPYILYLNDDVEAFPGWLEPLVEMLDSHPRVGAVGSRLFYPDGRIQHDGKMFSAEDRTPYHVNMGGKAVADERPTEVDALTAACLLVRRELAGFSEDYVRGYYEDTDLCMRIKEQGYALVLHRGSVLIHYHGMSMGKNQTKTEEAQARNKKLFLERWGDRLEAMVYLANEKELAGKELRCKGVLPPDEPTDSWPISRRLL